MKWLPSGWLLVVAVLLTAVTAACGSGDSGGGELSLEQYFDQVGSITGNLEERAEALDQPLEQEFDSEVEQVQAVRDAFTTVLPAFEDFINDLDALNPPPEAAAAHDELVAGFTNVVGGLENLIDQLAEVETAAEFSALLFDPGSGFESAIGQVTAACLQLQSIADDNGIDAGLLECDQ